MSWAGEVGSARRGTMSQGTRSWRVAYYLVALLLLLSTTPLVSSAAGCSATFGGESIQFGACTSLDNAGKFNLSWTPNPSSPRGNTVKVLFSGTPEDAFGWAGWAISPTGNMRGSDAIVGYGDASNPGFPGGVKSYFLKNTLPTAVFASQSSGLMTAVNGSLAVEVLSGGRVVKILADISISAQGLVNVIWRGGPMAVASTGELFPHNRLARETIQINFFDSTSAAVGAVDTSARNSQQKTAHAFLAATGFGVLLPAGILVARHVKLWADPAWFYSHIVLQVLGYLVGVSGWGIGIWLSLQFGGMKLAPQSQFSHYCIGITVFCSSTLQIFTPILKPDKASAARLSWNLVHWGLGYATVILSVVNIFMGFNILEDGGMSYGGWKTAYIVFICAWGAAMLILEPVSWIICRRKLEEGKHTQLSHSQKSAQKDVEEEVAPV